MNPLEMTFEFEELNIPVCGKNCAGVMLYGMAFLEGDHDGFTVCKIRMQGGQWLKRADNLDMGAPDPLADLMFKRIAEVIENPKTKIGKLAEGGWIDKHHDHGPSVDPDYLRDMQFDREHA